MAKAIVTYEAVAAAAAALLAVGDEPSTIKVQAQIGGGSFTTVKRFLDQWKEQRDPATAQAVVVPEAVAAQGQALVSSLWQAAVSLAAVETAEVRRTTQMLVERAAQSEQEALLAVEQLEAQVELLEAQLEAAQQQIVALTAQRPNEE